MIEAPEHIVAKLREVADAGGTVVDWEGRFEDVEVLGLVTTSLYGGGFDARETVTLTNNGRRLLGHPVVTPAVGASFSTRLRSYLGIVKPSSK